MAEYIIEDARGERHIRGEAFPLEIGGPEADIEIDGLAEPLAYLGLSEGEVFVQPASDEPGLGTLSCNGTALTKAHWLRDGDELRLGPDHGEDVRLLIEDDNGGMRFAVREAPKKNRPVLTPPPREELEQVERRGHGAAVRPVAFKPRQAVATSARRRSFRWVTLFVMLVFGALVVAATFLFTARSVLIEFEPAPDSMNVVDGFVFDMGGRYLMRPGSYEVVAEKAGYQPFASAIEVNDRDSLQTFQFALDLLPGILELTVRPGGDDGAAVAAEVLVDGESVGTTPLAPLELAPGGHELTVRAERYELFTSSIEIEGAGTSQSLEVELLPLWAGVSFSSTPPGATVRIDGAAVGKTPLTVDVNEGRHGWDLSLAGYKPRRGQISVAAQEPLAVPAVKLEPTDGNLVLLSEPPGATVSIDGTYGGKTPLDLKLAPGGPYSIKVAKAGHEAVTRLVEVRSDETQEIHVTLTAQTGELRIGTWPADAELYVNGEARGAANQILTLQAVQHDIEVKKAGYVTYRTQVELMAGVTQALEVKLESEEVKKERENPSIIKTAEGQVMKRVEPGRFVMGTSRREPGRQANEVLREVELTRPYYLGVLEISNAELRRFKTAHLSGSASGRTLEHDDHPAVGLTWQEAAAYCNWLSQKEGLPHAYIMKGEVFVAAEPMTTGYRLPTEAEWAWAARFSDGKAAVKFPWGDSMPIAEDSGNYADASAREVLPGVLSDYDDSFAVTAPVDNFEANALGIKNLGGNVAEWVHDFYTIRPAGAMQLVKDPMGPADGTFHVIRGSSWMHSTLTELRLTFRDYNDKSRPDVGFRIARYAE